MMNNTDSTCVTGEAYTIEQRVNGEWTVLPFKPRKDGAVYAFNDIGYELAPHSTRLFTIHVEPDKYDFERGREYRIVKEFFKSRPSNPQSVYPTKVKYVKFAPLFYAFHSRQYIFPPFNT